MNIEPTAHGFIRNAINALLIVEACLQGESFHIPRTLRPEEARSAVYDGTISVYEVESSGIDEWHDHHQSYHEFRLGDFTVFCEAHMGPTYQMGRLIKQSMVLHWDGVRHHVISYFQVGTLQRAVSEGTEAPLDLDQIIIPDGLLEEQRHIRHSVAYRPWLGWRAEHWTLQNGLFAQRPDSESCRE
ncbi:uncharacterized protein BKA55DRAFT_697676 [Fusarium redolens]|uniref:Uncharacterized protein n=1 Tax=Fusarium redolens TaxID=48865 RepID=A0A9P9FZM3_FUSRE|nr:uncharacterized protein BKA55DRAFT_697676 [Fusarium redolens]KAH7216967.1 hypothetical protein BKA55DRAFT_697676 [Fusarium redolens]